MLMVLVGRRAVWYTCSQYLQTARLRTWHGCKAFSGVPQSMPTPCACEAQSRQSSHHQLSAVVAVPEALVRIRALEL